MEIKHILFMLWIIVVFLWLINQFYYTNQKRELAYRKARAAEKAAEES